MEDNKVLVQVEIDGELADTLRYLLPRTGFTSLAVLGKVAICYYAETFHLTQKYGLPFFAEEGDKSQRRRVYFVANLFPSMSLRATWSDKK